MLESARRAAEHVAARRDELARLWVEKMEEDPELRELATSIPDLRTIAWQNARSDIGRELRSLVDNFSLPAACPEEVATSARLAARSRLPLGVLFQSYRTGHALQWQAWLDAVEEIGFTGDQRRVLLDLGSSFMFAWADRCSRWGEAEYTRENERLLRDDEQRRTQAVRDVLAGRPFSSEDLGYPLQAEHLSIVAWGTEPLAALEAVGDELRCPLLFLAADHESYWAWLGSLDSWSPRELRLVADLDPPAGTALAVGGPSLGAPGFRSAHEQARHAYGVARRLSSRGVTRYDEVALVALASHDEEGARAFVAHELGRLEGGRRGEILRETLRAYFVSGQRASSAASVLGVHERTVANRIRAIEERLRRPVGSRSSELETALRLELLLEAGSPVEVPNALRFESERPQAAN